MTPVVRHAIGALRDGSDRIACPACGGDNASDARFCDDCGQPLARS